MNLSKWTCNVFDWSNKTSHQFDIKVISGFKCWRFRMLCWIHRWSPYLRGKFVPQCPHTRLIFFLKTKNICTIVHTLKHVQFIRKGDILECRKACFDYFLMTCNQFCNKWANTYLRNSDQRLLFIGSTHIYEITFELH